MASSTKKDEQASTRRILSGAADSGPYRTRTSKVPQTATSLLCSSFPSKLLNKASSTMKLPVSAKEPGTTASTSDVGQTSQWKHIKPSTQISILPPRAKLSSTPTSLQSHSKVSPSTTTTTQPSSWYDHTKRFSRTYSTTRVESLTQTPYKTLSHELSNLKAKDSELRAKTFQLHRLLDSAASKLHSSNHSSKAEPTREFQSTHCTREVSPLKPSITCKSANFTPPAISASKSSQVNSLTLTPRYGRILSAKQTASQSFFSQTSRTHTSMPRVKRSETTQKCGSVTVSDKVLLNLGHEKTRAPQPYSALSMESTTHNLGVKHPLSVNKQPYNCETEQTIPKEMIPIKDPMLQVASSVQKQQPLGLSKATATASSPRQATKREPMELGGLYKSDCKYPLLPASGLEHSKKQNQSQTSSLSTSLQARSKVSTSSTAKSAQQPSSQYNHTLAQTSSIEARNRSKFASRTPLVTSYVRKSLLPTTQSSNHIEAKSKSQNESTSKMETEVGTLSLQTEPFLKDKENFPTSQAEYITASTSSGRKVAATKQDQFHRTQSSRVPQTVSTLQPSTIDPSILIRRKRISELLSSIKESIPAASESFSPQTSRTKPINARKEVQTHTSLYERTKTEPSQTYSAMHVDPRRSANPQKSPTLSTLESFKARDRIVPNSSAQVRLSFTDQEASTVQSEQVLSAQKKD